MMANEQLAEEQRKQEAELAAFLESMESARWNIFRDFKFVYCIDMEYHDFVHELDKLALKLKQEQENERK